MGAGERLEMSWREAMFEGEPRFVDVQRVARGMAATFRALDRARGEHVAIREMPRQEEGTTKAFVRGYEALRRTAEGAPGCVPAVSDLFMGQAEMAFAIEWIDGEDFRAHAAHGEPALRAAFTGLIRALDAIHRVGLVHRDIRPEHVLVTPAGRVVLISFAAACSPESTTTTSENVITANPIYMSPEVLRGEPSSAAVDLWGAGVMLFEALTGRPPFQGQHVMGLLRQILMEKAPAPSAMAPGVPEDLDRLCVGMLARDPAKRPSTAEVLRRLGAPPRDPTGGA
jgi:serine/threonine protein kinase